MISGPLLAVHYMNPHRYQERHQGGGRVPEKMYHVSSIHLILGSRKRMVFYKIYDVPKIQAAQYAAKPNHKTSESCTSLSFWLQIDISNQGQR